jgi:hypothetical protein
MGRFASRSSLVAKVKVTKPIQYLSFLFTNVLTKISRHAIGKVAAIRDAYLPPGRDKKEIKECTGATTRTLGIPCIHVIKSHVDEQRPLSIDQFHRHWHLHAPETLPPVDPRLLLLEPRVNRTRGRPAGAINRPTAQELSQARSTQRDPSSFEYVLEEGRGGRGRGRGRGRGSTTSQVSAQELTQESGGNNGRGRSGRGNNGRSNNGRGARGGGSNNGGGRGRGRGRGPASGIPPEMLNQFSF